MANAIYIRDLASLEHLRIAISRFCDSCETKLPEIDSKIQTRLGSLKACESEFRQRIERAAEDLRRAQAALHSCQESGSYGDDDDYSEPDCSGAEEEVIECRKMLRETEMQMQTFQRQMQLLDAAIAQYQNPKLRFRNFVQFEKEAAPASLKQLINGAEDYMSVSASSSVSDFNGPGIADAIAKIDPTVVVAAAAGLAEIIVMSVFAFVSAGGRPLKVLNSTKNNLITSSLEDKGVLYPCSAFKIERRSGVASAQIVDMSIPQHLQTERIGRHLVQNMECVSRQNDCTEISGWSSVQNVGFYRNLGYGTRKEIQDVGAEVYKPLDGTFSAFQKSATTQFEQINNAEFIKGSVSKKQVIDPLRIITPDEIDDEKFWKQHGEDQARYVDLIEKYDKCVGLLNSGKSLDEIRAEDMWVANAYDVFHGSDPVRLQKSGEFYRLDGSGRHRVAAAQLYFLQTGKSVPLVADITEKV